jgi:hypothetical protein
MQAIKMTEKAFASMEALPAYIAGLKHQGCIFF